MRILLLANKLPYPANDGSSIALASMIEGFLHNGVELTVLALNTAKHRKNPNDIPTNIAKKVDFEIVEVNTNPTLANAFANLFQRLPFHVSRFFQPEVANKLKAILAAKTYDVVQCEGLFMMPYKQIVKELSKAKIVLRAHNVEHLIWQRAALAERKPVLRQFLVSQTEKLKRYEIHCAKFADAIIPISPIDAVFFNTLNQKVHTAPFGVAALEKRTFDYQSHSFFHLGAMDWLPNVQGIKWLLEAVWPLVMAKNHRLTLHLGGRTMPKWLLNLEQQGVVVHATVADAAAFRQKNGNMLVPLLAGSGMRIKIIEGLAAGLPIISTEIGAEGIKVGHNKHILLASTAQQFADAILYVADNPTEGARIGKNAANLAAESYLNSKIIEELVAFYKQTWQLA